MQLTTSKTSLATNYDFFTPSYLAAKNWKSYSSCDVYATRDENMHFCALQLMYVIVYVVGRNASDLINPKNQSSLP